MSNNLEQIGFIVNSDDDFLNLATNLANKSPIFETNKGVYIGWSESENFGPELWIQAEGNEIIGLHPYFRGKSEVYVGAMNLDNSPDHSQLDASLYVWLDPETDDPESGVCPCLIDMVRFLCYENVKFPFIDTLSVAAFPQEIEIYGSEDEYKNETSRFTEEEPENEDMPLNMASESLIPVGLFGEEENAQAEPYAMFTGKIIETKKMINSHSQQEYIWALVKTLGGTVDVVIAAEYAIKPVVEGGIISGVFWMCADFK